jgi:hypothetical protein
MGKKRNVRSESECFQTEISTLSGGLRSSKQTGYVDNVAHILNFSEIIGETADSKHEVASCVSTDSVLR